VDSRDIEAEESAAEAGINENAMVFLITPGKELEGNIYRKLVNLIF